MRHWIHAWFALIAAALSITPRAFAVQRPNVVFVLIDDMGWGDLSCFGNQEAKTPAIDRMAAEGLRFTQFYVSSPICSPSRCGLLTGQYPQRWRITSYLNNRADNKRRGVANWLDTSAPSLGRILSDAGYSAGHFGKWHLGGQRDVDDAPPITAYGFSESLTNFEGMGPKLLPLTQKPGDATSGRIWADAERLGKPFTWMQRSQITGGYTAAAIRFMTAATATGKPFYVNVWPDDVHSPHWPPVENWKSTKRGQYLAVLEQMDRQLGTLFDYIRSNEKLRSNTIVLICSDNGHEPGSGSGGPLRGAKGSLFEGGIRSPLIVWAPGLMEKASAGTTNESTVLSGMDIAPSVCGITGTAAPEAVKFDGWDASGILLGKSRAPRPAPVFWRRPPDRKWMPAAGKEAMQDLAVRDGDWKLLCDYDGSRPRLYRIPSDGGEARDQSSAEPAVVERLRNLAMKWHESLPPDAGPSLGSEKSGEQ